jgi:hypothetical protein
VVVDAKGSVFLEWKIHRVISLFSHSHFASLVLRCILCIPSSFPSFPQSVIDYVTDAGLDTAAFPFDEIVAVGAK